MLLFIHRVGVYNCILIVMMFIASICSGRPGSVQQQYRPRSPASVPIQGNAIGCAPPCGSGASAEHTGPVNQGANACSM